jgi:alkylation response protein AidB-like acyl-CoA dehydrogenase
MRDFEAAGTWDGAALDISGGFGLSGLDLPGDWGGGGLGTLAKVVALEAAAWGDAGGLWAADSVGPAAAAMLACPDRAGREAATAVLTRGGRTHLALGRPRRLAWVPGNDAPARTWMCQGDELQLLDTSACRARPAPAAAFEASGGISLSLRGAERLGRWRIGADAGRRLRGRARLWPAAAAVGLAQASLDYAIAYAQERVVMGKPVAHHQGNAFAIAGAWADLDAARVMVRAAATRIDSDAPGAGLWATLAYLDAVDAAEAATDLGVQLLGGHGYVEDHPAEKWYREARAMAALLGGRDAAQEDSEADILLAPDPVLA